MEKEEENIRLLCSPIQQMKHAKKSGVPTLAHRFAFQLIFFLLDNKFP
jgi:hypothetical protein